MLITTKEMHLSIVGNSKNNSDCTIAMKEDAFNKVHLNNYSSISIDTLLFVVFR